MTIERKTFRLPALLLTTILLQPVSVAPARAYGALALAPGDEAPLLMGRSPQSGKTEAVDWSGTVTLVNFWATWCQPCLAEMPELQRMQNDHREAGFRIVGITKEELAPEEILAVLDELGVSYPVLRPNPKIVRRWHGVGSLPTSFLIDREGKVRRRYVGVTDGHLEALERDVVDLLEGRELQPPHTGPAKTDMGPAAPENTTSDQRRLEQR